MNPAEAIARHGLKLHGVIQVGSHWGEEQPIWTALGLPAIHFEPVRANVEKLRAACAGHRARVIDLALGNRKERALINTETSNGGQSCSLLQPKLHLQEFPQIAFDGSEQVLVWRLDDVHEIYQPDLLDGYDFLYMDAQGYELEILKGAARTLDQISAIITEVNRGELFEGCAMVDELDWHLSFAGFKRVETNWHSRLFGDALYLR